MTSLKWTFSLASLVVLLAIGLIFAPTAMAHETKPKNAAGEEVVANPHHPSVTLSVPSALPRGFATNTTTNSVMDASSMADLQMLDPTDEGHLVIQAKWSVFIDKPDFTFADVLLEGFDGNGFPVPITATLSADTVKISNLGDYNFDQDSADPGEDASLTDGINYTIAILGSVVPATVKTLYVSIVDAALINPDPSIHPLHKAHPKSKVSAKLKIGLVTDNPDTDNDGNTAADPNASDPNVISVMRVPNVMTPVSGTFTVQALLSEMPAGTIGPGSFTIENGTISQVDPGVPYDAVAVTRGVTDLNNDGDTDDPGEGTITAGADNSTDNPLATGFDDKYYPYYLTVTPNFQLEKDKQHKVTIKVNDFMDSNQPEANEYSAGLDPDYEIPIALSALLGPVPGFSHPTGVANQKALPAVTVPKGGYLVLLNHDAEVGHDKHAGIQAPAATDDYVVHQKYSWQGANIHAADLESFFRNGGTLQVIGPKATTNSLIITEIMWGSLNGDVKNQWIELHNPGTTDLTITANEWFLGVYGPSGRSAADLAADTASKVVDEMSNSGGTSYWSVQGKGQSGRTSNAPGDPNEDAISMSRVLVGESYAADGTMADNWAASMLPSANIRGLRVGTPGAGNMYDTSVQDAARNAAKAAADKAAADAKAAADKAAADAAASKVSPATKNDITITEIMADSGNNRFPQWIELTNQAAGEVSLDDWTLNIDNGADADVLGSSLVIDLSGNTLGVSEHPGNLGKGQSLLVIAFSGRGSDNLGNVAIVDASDADQLDQTGRYLLLSETAFKIVLMPPQDTGVTVYGDMAGNLKDGAAAWALPMAEGMRSSLIRMEKDTANMATMGTSADGWRQASMTDLASGQITWYGSDEDAGTPGYDNGGPLPVELSMFYPKRDQLTGQVVITWETQSELNNAGFFIKRSEAQDGKFVVINPQMIAGAGTTSEKQSYTYTDTSAKPNVVYYYQIEDVSLDGQRQLLTIGTRLRGHIGAAGKLTTKWGELKSQE